MADNVLGSRAPKGYSFLTLRKPRENWCDMRQHYVNERQMPLFTTYDCRLRYGGKPARYVCFPCMLSYRKDGVMNDYADGVPDNSEPAYTTGEVTIRRG